MTAARIGTGKGRGHGLVIIRPCPLRLAVDMSVYEVIGNNFFVNTC